MKLKYELHTHAHTHTPVHLYAMPTYVKGQQQLQAKHHFFNEHEKRTL